MLKKINKELGLKRSLTNMVAVFNSENEIRQTVIERDLLIK